MTIIKDKTLNVNSMGRVSKCETLTLDLVLLCCLFRIEVINHRELGHFEGELGQLGRFI